MPTDFLHEFTKEEIILWIRKNCHYTIPKKSDLLFIRWQHKENELQIKREQLSNDFNAIDVRKRDNLVRKFNASTNTEEKLSILKEMEPYSKAIDLWFQKNTALRKEEEKAEQLYKSIDETRQKEHGFLPTKQRI